MSCLSLFVAVLLIGGAVSFNLDDLLELINTPLTLSLELLVPVEFAEKLVSVYKLFRNISESKVEALPISKIKGRLLTPEEGCGYSKEMNTRIVGGQEAKKGTWPWMALLGFRKSFFFYKLLCGGSLITSRHVLSAAHCVDHELSFVRLGEHDTRTISDGPNQDVKVVRTEQHNYDSFDLKNDIAILYLAFDVIFTDRVRPICLPVYEPDRSQSFVGSNPFVAGWGYQQEKGPLSPVLYQVQLPVVENKVCTDIYAREEVLNTSDQFSEEIICAGEKHSGKDSCVGDSGGPLMLPYSHGFTFLYSQIGIVAYGLGCHDDNIPGGYANVAFYADWILKKLRR